MRLKAHLTIGWDESEKPRARNLHDTALQEHDQKRYAEKLTELAADTEEIFGLDELFRRGAEGFTPIKQFIAALAGAGSDKRICCHIDYFAYSFLKKAKNIDLSLPVDQKSLKKLEKEKIDSWKDQIHRLEQLERFGSHIDKDEKEKYLALRPVALRKTARDEWRAMAILLLSGPSTMDEISKDLSLGYTLGPRVLKPFTDAGAVNHDNQRLRYDINLDHMPTILFFLRELLGLDLLGGF